MPPKTKVRSSQAQTQPVYDRLVRFLVEPFLESPQSLRIDCERSNHNQRVWIRLAFEQSDKGRVFGRGGRNIQAIRTVLQAAASAANQSVYLDIYGSSTPPVPREDGSDQKTVGRRRTPRRSSS